MAPAALCWQDTIICTLSKFLVLFTAACRCVIRMCGVFWSLFWLCLAVPLPLWPPLPVAPLPKCPLPLPLPLWNTFTGRVLTVSVVSADLTVAAATVVPVPFCEDALYSVHCICQLQDILHVSSTQLLVCNCSPNIFWQFCCPYATYSFFAAACLHRLLLMCAY